MFSERLRHWNMPQLQHFDLLFHHTPQSYSISNIPKPLGPRVLASHPADEPIILENLSYPHLGPTTRRLHTHK